MKEYHHSWKFFKSIANLDINSGSLSKYQEVIKAANNRFMNDVILKGLKAMKGHKFNTSLTFFIVRARKLDRFVDRSDINRNANYLVHEGDVFETFKDFSCGYNQWKLKKFDELVKKYKRKLIDSNGNEHFDENDSNVEEDNSSKEHEYVGEEQREQLERSLKNRRK